MKALLVLAALLALAPIATATTDIALPPREAEIHTPLRPEIR